MNPQEPLSTVQTGIKTEIKVLPTKLWHQQAACKCFLSVPGSIMFFNSVFQLPAIHTRNT